MGIIKKLESYLQDLIAAVVVIFLNPGQCRCIISMALVLVNDALKYPKGTVFDKCIFSQSRYINKTTNHICDKK
jgi:hypothetical protein